MSRVFGSNLLFVLITCHVRSCPFQPKPFGEGNGEKVDRPFTCVAMYRPAHVGSTGYCQGRS